MVRILRLNDVTEAVGLRPSTIRRLIAREDFPRPRQLSDNSTGWLSTEVEQWIEARPLVAPSGKSPNWGDKRNNEGRIDKRRASRS